MKNALAFPRRRVCAECGGEFYRSGPGGYRYCSDKCRREALFRRGGGDEAAELRRVIKELRRRAAEAEREERRRKKEEERRRKLTEKRCAGCVHWRRATEVGYFCHYILDTGESCRKYRSPDGKTCLKRETM